MLSLERGFTVYSDEVQRDVLRPIHGTDRADDLESNEHIHKNKNGRSVERSGPQWLLEAK